MLGAVNTRWCLCVAYRVWSDQENDEARGSKDRVASARGSHSDSFHDTIRCRGASGFTHHFQTPCGSDSSVQAPCSCTSFNTETSATPSAVVHARATWNGTNWQNVVLSDESRSVLGTDDNRVRVWRRPGAIFQQDNARPHTARVAQDFLRHVQTLPWPARAPDLSPTEQVWDQLKHQMPLHYSAHDLEVAVQDLWVYLPQDYIRRLINTMPNCVAAFIAARGGPTSY
ncbi:hypothetical protein AVEN_151745-1 [Araneus ventricosus]|uniref:Tc1-like transposase DDE domain-containing protein n=1 Tax=Araneus ventricosus TaxID=182803 RepID=A0A4Y2U5L6_ARAVE|nr:hypothetical protein AVEN_151745-1 [Araneus ventricosus]